MRRAEGVVLAFAAAGEAGQPASLPQCANAITSAGENLMWVSLMANVPKNFIVGRIKDVVQCHGEFDYAEPRAKMAPGIGHRIDHFLAQLVGHLPHFIRGEFPKVGRERDCI